MDFFSGLKQAYDSLGTEISKTFDSSTQETKGEQRETATPEPFQEQSFTAEIEDHREVGGSSGGGDGWGEWEDQPAGPRSLATPQDKLETLSPRSRGIKLQGQKSRVSERQQRSDQVPDCMSETSPSLKTEVLTQSPEVGGAKSPPLATSTPAKQAGKTQLDSLSREDLVKYVKKQAQLLQKTKARCDELTKTCNELKTSSPQETAPASSTSEALLEELQVVRGERDRAVGEGKSLRQTITALEQDKQDLGVKVQAIVEETEVLKQSLQRLQQSSASREEDLQCQLEVSRTRLTALQEMNKSEKEDILKQVESLTEELKQSKQVQSDLESQLAAERAKEEPDSAGERDRALSEAAVLRDELQRVQEEERRRNGELETVVEEKERLLREYEEGERRWEEGRRKVEELQKQLKMSKRQCAEEVSGLRKKKEELATEVEGLKAALESTKQQLHRETEAKESSISEVACVRSEMAEVERTLQDKKESLKILEDEKLQLQERCSGLTTQVAEMEGQVAAVSNQLELVQSEKAELEKLQLAGERGEKTKLEAEVEAVGREREEVRREKVKLEAEVEAVGREREELRGEKVKLEAEVEAVGREREELRGEKVKLEAEVEAVGREREELRGEKVKLEAEVEAVGREREELRGEKVKLEAEVEAVGREREELRGEKVKLEAEVEAVGREREELRGEKVKLEAEVEAVGREREELRGEKVKLEAVGREREELRGEKVKLEAEVEAVGREREELRGEKVKLEARTKELEAQLQSHQSELESVRDERESFQHAAESVQQDNQSRVDELLQENEALRSGKEQVAGDLRELELLRERCEVMRGERDAVKRAAEEQATAHKEESKKLKAFIVKMKRELSETKEREASLKQQLEGAQGAGAELGRLREELQVALAEREVLQKQMDQAVASLEAEKQSAMEGGAERVQELEGQMEALQRELHAVQKREAESAALSSERDVLQSRVWKLEEAEEVLQSELATVQSDLATMTSQANTHRMATERVQLELQSVKEELERERERHAESKLKLATAEKEVKASTLMDLELADYQRSMQSLEGELASREDQLQEARRASQIHLDTTHLLKKEQESLAQQLNQSEEKVTKMKALLVKSKKELAEAKKQEAELQGVMSDLQSQLEAEKQHSELAKVEVSELTGKLLAIQQQSDSSVETLQRTIRTLELKMASVQGELSTTQAALTETRQEYENYKVRVHSVLKQKSNGPRQAEISSELRQKYETEITKLKAELQETKDQLSSALLDHEELLVEHDQLAGRHDQLLQEVRADREQWQRKFQEEESRHSAVVQEQSELILQLRQEALEVTTSFKTQLHSLQEEHRRVIDGLKEESKAAHREVSRLQQEADTKVLARAAASQEGGGGQGKEPQTQEAKLVPPKEQRSAGEGMDQAELESTASFPQTPLSREDSHVSFERLLSMSTVDLPPAEEQLHKQLRAASRKIEHLTELLRESEASSMRLSDQAKLLKEEIRRLERNQEREQGVSNMEYLKNVVLKFLYTVGPEQASLIPIITKLLQLSPQEIKFLQETIKGNPSELPSASGTTPTSTANKGWSSYIHRWTGH